MKRCFMFIVLLVASTGGGCSSVATGMIRGYQEYVSPYGWWRCPFEPSCSQYALESIEQQGTFWGILMAGDRLSRCNGFGDGHYHAVYPGGKYKLKDPPEENWIFGDKQSGTPRRSPVVGGLLSALLPGAGQCANGYWMDGLTAFLLTAGPAYASYESFDNDNDAFGAAAGGIAALFYLANIYGGANSARRHDREMARDREEQRRPDETPSERRDARPGVLLPLISVDF